MCNSEQVDVTLKGFLIMQIAIVEPNHSKDVLHKLFCDVWTLVLDHL